MMKKIVMLLLVLVSSLASRAQYVPSEEVKQSQKAFQDDKFGVFIHWGIYSMLGDGEWVMNNKNLNYKEYAHLADGFYPSRFDADAWVKAFADAGAKYITITSRHHDGFSMFHSKASPFNIVDATPFRRDVLKELSEACARHDVKLHIYYSHLDWTRDDYPVGKTGQGTGRPTGHQSYDSYLRFMKQQLTELLTGYGPVRAIWFDGWWDKGERDGFDWRLGEQYSLIHGLQPACMVANNHHVKPYEGEDLQIFEQDLPGENTAGFSEGQHVAQLPLETCLTMNGSWGYSISDKSYKTTDELIRKLVRAAGMNANLLLNVGPRPDGQLPDEALERLQQLGQWMRANGATIYGTRGGMVAPQPWGVTTQKGRTLYVHILSHAEAMLTLPAEVAKVARSAHMFASGEKVKMMKSKAGLTLQLPAVPTGVDTIVELTLK